MIYMQSCKYTHFYTNYPYSLMLIYCENKLNNFQETQYIEKIPPPPPHTHTHHKRTGAFAISEFSRVGTGVPIHPNDFVF
jgi:hypothetical protein